MELIKETGLIELTEDETMIREHALTQSMLERIDQDRSDGNSTRINPDSATGQLIRRLVSEHQTRAWNYIRSRATPADPPAPPPPPPEPPAGEAASVTPPKPLRHRQARKAHQLETQSMLDDRVRIIRENQDAANGQILVSAEILKEILDLPASYHIVGAIAFARDAEHSQIRILVKSDALPEVLPGDPIPELNAVYIKHTRSFVRLAEIRAIPHTALAPA